MTPVVRAELQAQLMPTFRARARLSSSRIAVVGLAATYIAIYTATYARILVPWYGYEGLAYIEPSWERLWAIRVAALLPALWLPTAVRRPSQVAYWLVYLFVLVPIQFVPIYSRIVDVDEFLVFVAAATGAFALIGALYRVPLVHLPRLRSNPRAYWTILFLASFALFGVFFATTGFRPHLVGIDGVYDVRAQYSAAAARGSRLVPYAISWQGNVLDSLFMAHGLVKRRVWLLALGVLGQVALYSITAYKGMLVSGVIFVCVLAAMRSEGSQIGSRLLLGVIGVLTAALAAYGFGLATTATTAALLDRVIGVPGLLTGYYFDFFSHHPKAMLGDGVLSSFIDYRYPYDVPHLIGDVYFHSPRMSANANFLADGYANFGYAGIFAFSALLGLVFWLYDSIAQEIDIRVASLMIVVPTLSVANCGLQTTLVTHGLALCMVVLALYPVKDTGAP